MIDCAIGLPFDEALTIADSALRNGSVTREQLAAGAQQVRRTGRVQALRVAAHADHRAENPFESVVRAISLDVPGLALRPQVQLRSGGRLIHPDLADVALGVVVEADSYEFHTRRRQIDIDCERYTELGLRRVAPDPRLAPAGDAAAGLGAFRLHACSGVPPTGRVPPAGHALTEVCRRTTTNRPTSAR